MMRLIKQGQARFRQQCTLVALLLAAISLSYAATTLNIPQVPLIMATPSHPQVFIAIGNSESMDGTLSGAIMTGSGSLASNASSLHASSSLASVFVTYNGPNPSTPFPPNFSLTNYNNAGVTVNYSSSAPNIGSFGTSPTNAGYVPFSRQVMYAQRGFGYYGTQSANSGRILVPMLSAGISPTTATVTNAINQFTPFLAPETNNASTTEIKAAAIQSPTAGLLRQANTYLTGLGITSGNCPQKKYVILISDGLPTQDLSDKLWPPLGSASAAGYGVTATFNSDGSLNSTNAQALTDAINTIKSLKSNGIATYIVGLGAGVDPTLNLQAAASLTAMAVAGGTGNYYPATDPQAMVHIVVAHITLVI